MLTATLTRPTTISPTASCDTRVYLAEMLDIAPIPEPRARVISLEPISRRARQKPPRKRGQTLEAGQPPSDHVESMRSGRVSILNSAPEESDLPGSPAPSDTSFESRVSSGNASGTEYGVRSVHTAMESSGSAAGSRGTLKNKTITATIQVKKGGFLRGDPIPITILVNHTKHVRSLKGIIVTLYRQARVDMHPALPVTSSSKGDKIKSEDYYPKSRTGLGGLSLSSAGSSHLFRKDLSQSFAPLFVDPRTLTAEVKCSVRVPDEAFPTISNVPGQMISFKYFVEVIIDIQGKLSGLDRLLPSSGLVNIPSGYGSNSTIGRTEDPAGSMFSTWGGTFADTDAIRREKSVISSLFEVVIGTKDSERNGKQKQRERDVTPNAPTTTDDIPTDPRNDPYNSIEQHDQQYYGYDPNGQYYGDWGDYGYDGAYDDAPGYHDAATTPSAAYTEPFPISGEDGELSEKERIRRAELRLLPSQPPGDPGPSEPVSGQAGMPPSAPIIEDENADGPWLAVAQGATSASSSASKSMPSSQPPRPPPPFATATPAPSTTAALIQQRPTDEDGQRAETESTVTLDADQRQSPTTTSNDANAPQSIPSYTPHSPAPVPKYLASSSHIQPTDNKQELQRQRLQTEASAPPPNDAEDVQPSHGPSTLAGSPARITPLLPSAPILNDEDEDLVDAMRPIHIADGGSSTRVDDTLPEYHR